jgi:hypothetical protein
MRSDIFPMFHRGVFARCSRKVFVLSFSLLWRPIRIALFRETQLGYNSTPVKASRFSPVAEDGKSIETFHDDLVIWCANGLSWRDMEKAIKKAGTGNIDHSKVRRYCIKHRIKKVTPSASKNLPPQPPTPWREPPPLFTPLVRVPAWTHDLELIRFGEQDVWTLQDACEGTFILGSTGSGKTTGSGRTLAEAFLSRGFGGLILTVKPDEAELWEAYARKMGRQDQLCVIRPSERYRLNFLDYESRRPGAGGGLIENLVSLFYTIIDARAQGMNDAKLANFWANAGKELLRNTFRVLTLATPKLSLADVRKFILESPQQERRNLVAAGPWFSSCMERAKAAAKGTPQDRVMEIVEQYWQNTFLRLAPETRSCIVTAFTGMADAFIEPAIHDLFCTETTITPEAVLDGAIIIVDLPLKNYDAVGIFAQSIWKYLFQKAIERRNDPNDSCRRPVFLWIDEAQYFHTAYDSLFQTTARSARCATVYLTQNISNFYGISGSSHSRDRVDGFLGNLNTKIFHCNNDHQSNVWAAEHIGRFRTQKFNTSITNQPRKPPSGFWEWLGGDEDQKSMSTGSQEVIEHAVQPSEFLNLRTGGERFGYQVDAYFVKSGSVFSNGRHFFPTVFQQEFS